jgi:hypothetical protein
MFVLLTPMQQPLSAQDAKPAAKAATKPRGRLPAYYGQVVSKEQREKIYSVQQSYAERIAALEAQLKELQEKMNGEIRAVLTAEQQKKIDELTEAGRKSRVKPATSTAEPAASATPAASAATAKSTTTTTTTKKTGK